MDKFLKNLIVGAGTILGNGYGKKFRTISKTVTGGITSDYDVKVERYIISKIKQKYPDHGIVAEESGQSGQVKNFWVIDPLDGSFGFTRGLGNFGVSIAFVSNNKVEMAAIYAPLSKELFFAKRGKGATLNGKKIKVSSTKNIENSSGHIWVHTVGAKRSSKKSLYGLLINNKVRPVIFPSTVIYLGHIAAGRLDFIASEGLYPWDYAAGSLILTEAGAKVTDISGQPYRWDSRSILAANPALYKQLKSAISKS